MNRHTRFPLALLAGLLAFSTATVPASAQEAPPTPVFLALPQVFPDVEARVVLMREAGRDIVILKEADAGAETLQVALGVLQRVRDDHRLPPDRAEVIPVTGFVFRDAIGAERREELEAVLAELRRRPLADVGNLGLGRWMPYQAP